MRKSTFLLMMAASLVITACQTEPQYLREAADNRNIDLGFAVHNSFFNMEANDPYVRILKENANTLVAENAMKPDNMQPQRGTFNFSEADQLVDFAEANNMKVRGHCLIWHSQIPHWMNDTTFTRDELLKVMEEHITTIVSRYKGRVHEWDVVNEAIDENEENNYRRSVWYKVIGPEYIDSAFVYAHRADSDAVLYYNDYSAEEMNKKSDAVYNLAKRLVENDIPIHAVGLQSHFWMNGYNAEAINKNMNRLGDLGLKANITELDLSIPVEEISDSTRNEQAGDYAELLRLCLENDHSDVFMIWGVIDSHSWIPGHTKGERGAALIFDENLEPKPAYYSLLEVLKKR